MKSSARKQLPQNREPETILEIRGRGRATEYLVKWLDHDDTHNSWHNSTELVPFKKILDDFRSNRLKTKIKEYQQSRRNSSTLKNSNPRSRSRNSRSNKKTAESVYLDSHSRVTGNELEGDLVDTMRGQLDLNKKEDNVKTDEHAPLSEQEVHQQVSSKVEKALNQMDKSFAEKMSKKLKKGTKDKDKVDARKKVDDGMIYITTDAIEGEKIHEIMKEEISKAIDIRSHLIIKGKLYFLLKWLDKDLNKFYANHYFKFNEIEDNNPTIFVSYMKEMLKETLGIKL